MSPAKRYATKQAKTRLRRRRSAQERLDRDRRQAQQAAEAWATDDSVFDKYGDHLGLVGH